MWTLRTGFPTCRPTEGTSKRIATAPAALLATRALAMAEGGGDVWIYGYDPDTVDWNLDRGSYRCHLLVQDRLHACAFAYLLHRR